MSPIECWMQTWKICLINVVISVSYTTATICGSYFYNMESCYSNQVCCYSGTYAYCCGGLTYGAIVGIVIGCLAGIAVFIALIVVCCNVMNKNRGMTGRVVYPGDSAGGVTVVNSHQHGNPNGSYGVNPGYGYGGQPLNPAYPPAGPSQYPPPGGFPAPPQYTEPAPPPKY